MKLRFLVAAVIWGLTAAAHAQTPEVPVDLELVLAVDVSASIDADEAALQRAGYLAALTSRQVIDAIRAGALGRIAVTYVEWAGGQRTIVGWAIIADMASARAFAATLRAAPLSSGASTSISGALDYAVSLLDDNGINGTRRAIDISGDGRNYSGRPLGVARAEALARGVTINALPMIQIDTAGRVLNPGLDRYYSEWVIGGPGAFAIPARGTDAFPEAILKKLIIEIAGRDEDDAAPRSAAATQLPLARQHVDARGDDEGDRWLRPSVPPAD